MNNIDYQKFSQINLNDSFFDSLRQDYNGFDEWFRRKKDQYAFVQYDGHNKIIGFLYLTRREQEIPHFYKWWDELRITRRFVDFCRVIVL